MLFGGRLLPRTLWTSPGGLNKLTSTIRTMVDDGVNAFDIAIRPTAKAAGNPHNAVLPAWRDAERTFNPTLLVFFCKNGNKVTDVTSSVQALERYC